MLRLLHGLTLLFVVEHFTNPCEIAVPGTNTRGSEIGSGVVVTRELSLSALRASMSLPSPA